MNAQDCEQLTLFPADSPASPFPWLESKKAKGTSVTSGRRCYELSESCARAAAVGENVPGIIKIAAGQVVKDLERAGYHVVVFNFEAAAVGAWHRRSRVFFVGIAETVPDPESERQQRERTCGEQIGRTRSYARKSARCGFVCDTMCQGLQDGTAETIRKPGADECSERSDWWAAEPDVDRMAHGIPNRVDRIKCLGNAVVPQQAYPIFKALREEVFR